MTTPWLPIESNPDVMNKLLESFGVPKKWGLVDVFGTESEALEWVPKPVLAVILLFPISPKHDAYQEAEKKRIEADGQKISDNLFYMRQVVSNACGTVALIHAIANNREKLGLAEGKFRELIDSCAKLSPEERGELLQKTAAEISSSHDELAHEGQTEVRPDEPVNHHFVAFVHVDGHLYELDGRKTFPIVHGETSEERLLKDATAVCKQFMDRDADDHNFTMMALTAVPSETGV